QRTQLFPYTTLFRSGGQTCARIGPRSVEVDSGCIPVRVEDVDLTVLGFLGCRDARDVGSDRRVAVDEGFAEVVNRVDLAVIFLIDRKSTRLNSSHVK